MAYLIDGHNLIGQLPDISLDDPNDEAKLVQKLAGFAGRLRVKVVVVFDHGLPGGKSRMSSGSVQVVFASHKTTADRVMIERIQKEPNPKSWIVVSSDNAVLAMARRRQMQTLKSPEFAQILRRPPPAAKPGPDVAADLVLSEEEVEEWLAIFSKPRKTKK
ncbi:MAG: NYN domain-containing protein [Anaerolineae bacterium]